MWDEMLNKNDPYKNAMNNKELYIPTVEDICGTVSCDECPYEETCPAAGDEE